MKRIKAVEDSFGTTGQTLYKTGRILVGEGFLTKLCRKKPKSRQFFLFNDILVYGNILINKKVYNKQHILPLEEVRIVKLEDDGNFLNGWQIISPGKSFAVYAATPNEKAEWIAHLDACIKDRLKKTGKKPSDDQAAVWVPDHSANICMLCKKTKFSPLVRRHHCRRCGSVVCGSCSSKRFLIPHISSKPVRVCDQCYNLMSNGEVQPDDPVQLKVQKTKPDHANSLTRNESENIAESGSSAEESDGEEGGVDDNKPTFYEENGSDVVNVKCDSPSRPSQPPVADTGILNNSDTTHEVSVSTGYDGGSSGSYSGGGGGGASSSGGGGASGGGDED